MTPFTVRCQIKHPLNREKAVRLAQRERATGSPAACIPPRLLESAPSKPARRGPLQSRRPKRPRR
jgi:hypothetical protein